MRIFRMCIIGMSIEVCGRGGFSKGAGRGGQMRQSPHLAGFVVESWWAGVI